MSFFKNIVGTVGKGIGDIVSTPLKITKKVGGSIGDFANTVGGKITNTVGAVKQGIGQVVQRMPVAIDEGINYVNGLQDKIFTQVGKNISHTLGGVGSGVGVIADQVTMPLRDGPAGMFMSMGIPLAAGAALIAAFTIVKKV